MHFRRMYLIINMSDDRIGLGFSYDAFNLCMSHVHAFFIHTVRSNLINHFVSFILCQFACNSALRNPVFIWESCKGSVWAQDCALSKGIATRSRALQVAKGCTWVKHAEELNSHASWSTTGQKSSLAIQLAHGLDSRLSQVARPSCQSTLFGKNWLFAFRIHTSINTPYTHET